MSKRFTVLGAGLAGLSCAYELAKAGHQVTVVEREAHVGGMASSFEQGDRATAGQPDSDYYSYDFGPHRFHTADKQLLRHAAEILGENQVWATRLSRIYILGQFFHYPLVLSNVLRSMSPLMVVRILADYTRVRILDVLGLSGLKDRNFSEWVVRRFGRTLAELFFIQYTEKTWGIPATEISADWANQRISVVGLVDTIIKTIFPPRNVPRTLVAEFMYPEVGGIGELARGYVRAIESMGGTVLVDNTVVRVHRDGMRVTHVECRRNGGTVVLESDEFVSTLPVTLLARSLVPAAPDEVKLAARSLQHVSIVFVYLEVNKPSVSPDNWIYLPQRELRVHRISEFKNFSPKAAPENRTLVCAEITCRAGDEIWRADGEQLRGIAVADLARVGLLQPEDVTGSFVKRIPFAYPLYSVTYAPHLQVVMDFVHRLENIKSGGRQGLFRYNNMDQSIEMGRQMATATDARAHEAVATEQQYFG